MSRLVSHFALLVALVTPITASAALFRVNSNADAVDARPGDGVCATASGGCTLRAAVQESNARGDHNAIHFPAGVFSLTIGGRNEDSAAAGDLDITRDVSIFGAGTAATTVQANLIDRIFDVHPQVLAFTLGEMTLRDGSADAPGGAVRVRFETRSTLTAPRVRIVSCLFAGNTATNGGAIATGIATGSFNADLLRPTVEIINSAFDGNHATVDAGAISISETYRTSIELSRFGTYEANDARFDGGAIRSDTTKGQELSIAWSIFATNVAGESGGAIRTSGYDGTFNLSRNAFIGNQAKQGGAIAACCGFIPAQPTTLPNASPHSIDESTFDGNRASVAGAAVFAETDALSMQGNTITDNGSTDVAALELASSVRQATLNRNLARNSKTCAGAFSERRDNVMTEGSCGLSPLEGNLVTSDLGVGPLQNNGGPTPTRELLSGSPAIDRITLGRLDQRGIQTYGSGTDAGSFEVSFDPLVVKTMTLLVSANTIASGAPVVLTAEVNEPATGFVTFRDGDDVIGYGDVSSSTSFTFTAWGLAPGAHRLTASFEPYVASTTSRSSEPVIVNVKASRRRVAR
jgi:predicted outer membrane repeat protein